MVEDNERRNQTEAEITWHKEKAVQGGCFGSLNNLKLYMSRLVDVSDCVFVCLILFCKLSIWHYNFIEKEKTTVLLILKIDWGATPRWTEFHLFPFSQDGKLFWLCMCGGRADSADETPL